MDTVLIVLAVVAVLVLLAGAWWLVRSRRAPSGPLAPPLLGAGWQFYSRPTELEPPGTVFRIDPSKRRYMVDTLEVTAQSGDEAVGRREESVQASMGMVARFFGLGPKLDVDAEHSETFVFDLKGASRQYVSDSDIDTVLDPWLEQHELREGSRYFVIREAVSGSEITYHLDRSQVDKLGGEASLTEAAKLEGNLHTSTSKSDYVLQQTFDKPMRIMFLPEELRPLTRGLAERTVIGRRPVTTPLIWEDATEPLSEEEGDV
jgi:hypothetical protein